MEILRWLQSFGTDLRAREMVKHTFIFAEELKHKANQYELLKYFSYVDAVIVGQFLVIHVFDGGKKLSQREQIAIQKYLRSSVHKLSAMCDSGTLQTPPILGGRGFADWFQEYSRKQLHSFEELGTLDDPPAYGTDDIALVITRNIIRHSDVGNPTTKAGRFVLLSSMFYRDFYLQCKMQFGSARGKKWTLARQ